MSVMATIRSSGHTNGITARALGTNTICCAQGTRYTVQINKKCRSKNRTKHNQKTTDGCIIGLIWQILNIELEERKMRD